MNRIYFGNMKLFINYHYHVFINYHYNVDGARSSSSGSYTSETIYNFFLPYNYTFVEFYVTSVDFDFDV